MNNPGESDPIAASVRRQFSPPSLEGLEQRIAEAATRQELELGNEFDVPPLEAVSEAVVLEPRRRHGWTIGVAVALAVAAAVLLVLARPWKQEAPSRFGRAAHRRNVDSTRSRATEFGRPRRLPANRRCLRELTCEESAARADAIENGERPLPPMPCDAESLAAATCAN